MGNELDKQNEQLDRINIQVELLLFKWDKIIKG